MYERKVTGLRQRVKEGGVNKTKKREVDKDWKSVNK